MGCVKDMDKVLRWGAMMEDSVTEKYREGSL